MRFYHANYLISKYNLNKKVNLKKSFYIKIIFNTEISKTIFLKIIFKLIKTINNEIT